MAKFEYTGRTPWPWLTALCLLAGFWSFSAGQDTLGTAGGFYRVRSDGGRWWFIDPGERQQLLFGVDGLHLTAPDAKPLQGEDADTKRDGILQVLKAADYNFIGPASDAELRHHGLPHVFSLDVAEHVATAEQSTYPDVYDAAFEDQVHQIVTEAARPAAEDHELIGYLSDDVLDWPSHPAALLTAYLTLSRRTGGRREAIDFIRLHYNTDIRKLNLEWGMKARDFDELQPPSSTPASTNPAFESVAAQFVQQVLVRYLQVCADAIHAADPNHLFLGADLTLGKAQWTDAASLADVVSVTVDADQDPLPLIAAVAEATQKPILINERGCASAPASAGELFGNPQVVGYLWNPGADWNAEPCAARRNGFWQTLNRAAIAQHRGGNP